MRPPVTTGTRGEFKDVRLLFRGSADFPAEVKADAARELNAALESERPWFESILQFALSEIAEAHEAVPRRSLPLPGRNRRFLPMAWGASGAPPRGTAFSSLPVRTWRDTA